MRLLDKENLRLDMTKLGFEPESLVKFEKAILKPYGMVLVTGPTGSGKTNTLYSSIARLNQPDTNIMTAEDPVEFQLQGVNQVQMKEQIGLNFAAALRAFLRQDPNIILVGEIRDFETAEIAIKAALTGHLVLSTLHTNGAPETITRLMNMGIEPFLVATSVHLICAQRLVRRICKDCSEVVDVPHQTLIEEGYTPQEVKTVKIYKGKGCGVCNNTGYKGRTGLYEVMEVDDEIRELVLVGASAVELKKKAIERGMITLRRSGLIKVSLGHDHARGSRARNHSLSLVKGREGTDMALSLSDLLKRMLEMSGSDLHITTNSPPQVRVHGHLVPLDLPQLTPAETKQLAYSVMTDSQKHRFEENLELDFSFGLKGLARFRANCFNQRGATAAVFRVIPFEIKSFNQLGLPAVVSKLCDKPRGLVLVTGPTGSGKSTTLAAMIDKINTERHDHILTIEDPIEFVHMNKNCLVNQRELHADTKSFTDALRAALREDPDVVLIGEMRDLETIESALRIAETGHLTLARCTPTRHRRPSTELSTSSRRTSSRRFERSFRWCWKASCAKACCPRVDGKGRAMCMEIMVPNAAIRNLIREDKIHQIYSAMQSGQEKFGMQTFNQSLATAYFQKQITIETALVAIEQPG